MSWKPMHLTAPAAATCAPAVVAATCWWNRPTLRALLSGPAGPPAFCWSIDEAIARAARAGSPLYVWSSRLGARHEAAAGAVGVAMFRVEDGFLRSIGLGAGFVTAASLAIDSRGIYYDATRPSDLEHDLEHGDLSSDDIAVGSAIRHRILEARLTKYNLASAAPLSLPRPPRNPVVLVPGQVADDASILRTVSTTIDPTAAENVNVQLLRQARARNPEALIVYKPHPDVTSGLRRGSIAPDVAASLADVVVPEADIVALIEAATHVETVSSLAGFEALLRGKSVACHGTPFYAGWGLTEDLAPMPRRTRRRTIDEVCAIAFTRYTRHIHPYSGRECSCLELIDGLVRQRGDRRHRMRNAVLARAAWACERLEL